VLYAGWAATRPFVPIPVFLILATPIGAAATALALGRRDGLSLDQLLLAAIRQRLATRYRVAAPEGVLPAPTWLTAATHTTDGTENDRRRGERIAPAPLRLPAEAIEPAGATDVGVLDLGRDGLAVVAVTSTVNFALRTAGEQEALVGSFARYLHSLTAPVQIAPTAWTCPARSPNCGNVPEVCRIRRWSPPRSITPTTSRRWGSRPSCCVGRSCWSCANPSCPRPPTAWAGCSARRPGAARPDPAVTASRPGTRECGRWPSSGWCGGSARRSNCSHRPGSW
jgi:hypothetical protein